MDPNAKEGAGIWGMTERGSVSNSGTPLRRWSTHEHEAVSECSNE